jgi:hypothetical protein
VLDDWPETRHLPPEPAATWYRFRGKVGFYENADNHEIALQYLSAADRVLRPAESINGSPYTKDSS